MTLFQEARLLLLYVLVLPNSSKLAASLYLRSFQQTLAQTAKVFDMIDGIRREGQAEFFSHHAQSLNMGPNDNAMTRYWQY